MGLSLVRLDERASGDRGVAMKNEFVDSRGIGGNGGLG